ncbi:MAG TPA: methyltransferase domain-containing protein [Polyangiaceae bacterium]|nr:methyltransferase domain-containing protein [Polyangiaceae bacterium]
MEPLSEDARAHREWLLSFCDVPSAGAVIDLGCGKGHDLRRLAALHSSPDLRLIGLDASEPNVSAAAESSAHDRRIQFSQHRFRDRLPFEDATFDVVYSNNLLECIQDRAVFVREIARILRPDGQAVVAHWDWDSQLFDGTDKALVRRLVHAFADWQQTWMDHADGWMGRRLWGLFQATSLFAGEVHARVLMNTSYVPPLYGHSRAQDFSALVDRGLATADDHARFMADLEEREKQGRYFYSITGYAYVGRRRPRHE